MHISLHKYGGLDQGLPVRRVRPERAEHTNQICAGRSLRRKRRVRAVVTPAALYVALRRSGRKRLAAFAVVLLTDLLARTR